MSEGDFGIDLFIAFLVTSRDVFGVGERLPKSWYKCYNIMLLTTTRKSFEKSKGVLII